METEAQSSSSIFAPRVVCPFEGTYFFDVQDEQLSDVAHCLTKLLGHPWQRSNQYASTLDGNLLDLISSLDTSIPVDSPTSAFSSTPSNIAGGVSSSPPKGCDSRSSLQSSVYGHRNQTLLVGTIPTGLADSVDHLPSYSSVHLPTETSELATDSKTGNTLARNSLLELGPASIRYPWPIAISTDDSNSVSGIQMNTDNQMRSEQAQHEDPWVKRSSPGRVPVTSPLSSEHHL
ncbi:unnamed protein product [Protopolystoma xenopodis]|uniref:Uncharacterized protein n=1 Tax=Protopolystoma xenopodis TaxID=117903 RepID=A0A3S5CHJ8_9PLAT|nr:unnamed protein product [Protopolystoma xenopodis]